MLSQALTDGDLGLLREGILDACDAQDGLADGLVSNPAACRFHPKALQCSGDKTAERLAPAQVQALQKVFGGTRNSAGQPLYYTWPWDPGIDHPSNDWRAWKLDRSTTSQANSRHVFLMEDALHGHFVTPPDRDPARMDAHGWIFNTDDDVKLTGFKAVAARCCLPTTWPTRSSRPTRWSTTASG